MGVPRAVDGGLFQLFKYLLNLKKYKINNLLMNFFI